MNNETQKLLLIGSTNGGFLFTCWDQLYLGDWPRHNEWAPICEYFKVNLDVFLVYDDHVIGWSATWSFVLKTLPLLFYQALFADSVSKAERAKYYNYLFISYVLPVRHRYESAHYDSRRRKLATLLHSPIQLQIWKNLTLYRQDRRHACAIPSLSSSLSLFTEFSPHYRQLQQR